MVSSGGEKMRLKAWATAKPKHRRLINFLTTSPCDIIVCLRAKKKLVQQEGQNGRKEWVELPDPVAEQEESFVYETTGLAIIDHEHRAKWQKLPHGMHSLIPSGTMIKPEHGAAIGQWRASGVGSDASVEELLPILTKAAAAGMESLHAAWKQHVVPAHKGVLKEMSDRHKPNLKKIAEDADEAREAELKRQSEPEVTGSGDIFKD
jgi:hypothetical protein